MNWVPITEGMPPSGHLVLAFFETEQLKHPVIIRAAWYARFTEEAGDMESEYEADEYDEETDCYYVREGWYETNQYEEVHWGITDPITHWMELPAPPERKDDAI